MISDSTVRGIRTAGKISRLTDELTVSVREKYLIVNRVSDGLTQHAERAIAEERLNHLCSLPEDGRLLSQDLAGEPIWPILRDSDAYLAIDGPMTELMAG
jgi:CO dehydrogenase maturation factor